MRSPSFQPCLSQEQAAGSSTIGIDSTGSLPRRFNTGALPAAPNETCLEVICIHSHRINQLETLSQSDLDMRINQWFACGLVLGFLQPCPAIRIANQYLASYTRKCW